ncbi:MAG: MBL fold metallo-hydrolase [Spirochaetia bacterium]
MFPFRFAVLGSGSKANSFVFSLGDFSFAVDNGFSGREFFRRCELGGFNPMDLRFFLLTHTHRDHYSGVGVVSRKLSIPVLCHRGITEHLRSSGDLYQVRGGGEGEYRVRDLLSLSLFQTSHDAPFSTGYTFVFGGKRVTILTDTGVITPEMESRAAESDLLFLEANYSREMLESCRYPAYLKRRIRSSRGHLGNADALDLLSRLRARGTFPQSVYLCHLSADSNSPARLREEMEAAGFAPGENIVICPKSSYISGPEPVTGC